MVLILSMIAFSIGIISLLTIKMGKQKTFQILFKSAPPKTFTSSHGYLLPTSLLPPPPKKRTVKKTFSSNQDDRSNQWSIERMIFIYYYVLSKHIFFTQWASFVQQIHQFPNHFEEEDVENIVIQIAPQYSKNNTSSTSFSSSSIEDRRSFIRSMT